MQCSLHRKNRFDSSPTRNKPNHAAHIAVPTESKTNGNDATKLQKPIEPNRGGPPAVAYVRTRRTRSLLRDKPHVKHLGQWAPRDEEKRPAVAHGGDRTGPTCCGLASSCSPGCASLGLTFGPVCAFKSFPAIMLFPYCSSSVSFYLSANVQQRVPKYLQRFIPHK
jgi:hypothetical protein